MHISDGILDVKVCAAGYAGAAALTGYALSRIKPDDISKVSVMSAVFFVSSLLHVKLGPTSCHLVLLGLTALVLGPLAPIALLTGLFFQAMMFGHGGITTLGVNTVLFSVPALLVYGAGRWVFPRVHRSWTRGIAAGVLASAGVFLAAALVLLVLLITNDRFYGIAAIFSASYAVLALVEGVLTGLIVSRLSTIKPELLPR